MRVTTWIVLAASLTLCATKSTAAEREDAKPDSSTARADSLAAAKEPTLPERETWGTYDPGKGFLVARTAHGELAISAYGLVRYINQTPGSQT